MAREWYSRPINSGYTVVDGTTTGNYNNGVPNTYVKTWMEYLVIQNDTDKANNRSRIDVKLYSQVIDGGSSTGMSSATTANNYGYVGFDNANQQYLNTTYNFNNFALNKFADATLTIPHNADGTKTITLQGAFQTLSGTWAITGGSASKSITLPAIDMYKPTLMASFTGQNYGYQSTLILERQASNLRENVTLSYGGTTLTLKTTSSSATTITFTVDRQYTPNTAYPSNSDWTLTIATYNGSTLIGTMTYTKRFSIRSDDTSYKPTLTAQPVASAVNETVTVLGTDTIALGYSKLKISANKANVSTKYGATISQRYVRFGGRYNVSGVNNTEYVSNLIEQGSDTSWAYVVVDSRGFESEWVTGSYPYYTVTPPRLTINECYRGNSDGTANESGTYIWATVTYDRDSINGKNAIRYKKGQVAGFSAVELQQSTRISLASSALAQNAYTVTFTIQDYFNTTTITRQIPSEDIPFNIREGGKGVGIGAYATQEGKALFGYIPWSPNGYEISPLTVADEMHRRFAKGAEMVGPSTFDRCLQGILSAKGGLCGSMQINADYTTGGVYISAGWYCFDYTPHRYGGSSYSDNGQHGVLHMYKIDDDSRQEYHILITWKNASGDWKIGKCARVVRSSNQISGYNGVTVNSSALSIDSNGLVTLNIVFTPTNQFIQSGTPFATIPRPELQMVCRDNNTNTPFLLQRYNDYGRLAVNSSNNYSGGATSINVTYLTDQPAYYYVASSGS